jgi:hypothetical protein
MEIVNTASVTYTHFYSALQRLTVQWKQPMRPTIDRHCWSAASRLREKDF